MAYNQRRCFTADESIFLEVFKASPIGIALQDFSQRPLCVNPALCSMLGFTEDEMRSKRWIELFPAEDAEKDCALFERLRAGAIKGYHLEKRLIRRDGTLIWGHLRISSLSGLSSPLVLAIVEDISERRTAQEEGSAIIRFSEDAIISQDLQGVIRSWNSGAQQMFGYSKKEIIGDLITKIIPSDVYPEEASFLDRLSRGEPVQRYETIHVAKNGEKVNVSITAFALRGASGAIIGISKVLRNIDDRKLVEELLSSFTRRLNDAREDERSNIARELHDDISQRIALVAIQLRLMQQAIPAAVPKLRQKAADAHEQLSNVLKDTQSLSRRLHSPKLEYLGLVEACRSFLVEVSEQRNIQVQFDCQDMPNTVSPEIDLCLFRVLQEAVHNAIKHSSSPEIRVSLTAGEQGIELEVHDLGTGFDPDEAMRGRGIGLINMKERLRLVDGTFLIKSRLQEGTIIHARVPVMRTGRAATAGV